MDSIIILLSSSTSAVRMKNALAGKGYAAKVISTPSRLSSGGCGYSVKAEVGAAAEAERIINSTEMKSRGIYLENTADGQSRYRKLPLL